MSKKKIPSQRMGRPPKYPKPEGAERSVARFQVSMRPKLFALLEGFRKSQNYKPERSAVLERAVERLLIEEGYCKAEDLADEAI